METKDIILGKAKYEDWQSMYRNVWSRPETAKYMAWKVTDNEEEARERMRRTITWQENYDSWVVYEKSSGQAVGFAGIEELRPNIYQDTGIALGPEYVGKGYGKQILQLLIEYCVSLGGTAFYYSARSGNSAAKALALSCGFVYQYAEQKTDLRSGKSYTLEIYKKDLGIQKKASSRGLLSGYADQELQKKEQTVQGNIITHASITARPFFEKRGYKVVKEQQIERQGVFLTNFAMKKER